MEPFVFLKTSNPYLLTMNHFTNCPEVPLVGNQDNATGTYVLVTEIIHWI